MSENKLSKEQQDFCYILLDYFHNIATDSKNADQLMHKGRFFDAMDQIRVCNQHAQLGEKKIKDFVASLRESEIW